jgi:hypothetical protein
MLVGTSVSFGLLYSLFSAIFLGLQRFAVPMVVFIANRLAFAGTVRAAVFFHSSLVIMAVAVACVNIATGSLQIVAWRKLASRIRVSLHGLDYGVLKKMLVFCSPLPFGRRV